MVKRLSGLPNIIVKWDVCSWLRSQPFLCDEDIQVCHCKGKHSAYAELLLRHVSSSSGSSPYVSSYYSTSSTSSPPPPLSYILPSALIQEASTYAGIFPSSCSQLNLRVREDDSAACIQAGFSEAASRSLLGGKNSVCAALSTGEALLTSIASGVAITLQKVWGAEKLPLIFLKIFELTSSSLVKEKTLRRDLRLVIVRDNEELFFSHSSSVKNVWTASRHLSRFVTWTLTPNSCCIYHLFSERSWNIEELEPTARWCWPVCLHRSALYLATDEDARQCDDLPIFGKCVFHLVGEKSTEEKSQRERTGEGKRKPTRESVRQTVKGKIYRANSAKLKTKSKKNNLSNTWPHARCWSIVFVRSDTGWVCILFEVAIRQEIKALRGAAVNWPYLLFTKDVLEILTW